MASATFTHPHRVNYSSCTVGNHVYYSRYLDMLEEARGEFFRSLGTPLASLQTDGTEFPVRACQILYRAAAQYDDVLAISLKINHLDRLWLKFGFTIANEHNTLIAEGQTDHVCTGIGQKPKRMPQQIYETLRIFSGEID